ncbi:MAG: hypothetical protein AB4080_04085 [Trichodesmium sp.]
MTRLLVVLALIFSTLYLVQFLLLTTGICAGNHDLLGDELPRVTLKAKCFVAGDLMFNPEISIILLPGTFVEPWDWSWFLIANSFFTFASTVSDYNRNLRIVSLVALSFILTTAIISRIKTGLFVVPTIFLLILAFSNQINSLRCLKKSIIIVTVTAIVMVILLFNFPYLNTTMKPQP